MAVRLKDQANTQLTLRFRVFDDGLGFRYEYQVPQVDSVFVMDELTSFNLAQDASHGLFPPVLKPTNCCIAPCPSARWIMPIPR